MSRRILSRRGEAVDVICKNDNFFCPCIGGAATCFCQDLFRRRRLDDSSHFVKQSLDLVMRLIARGAYTIVLLPNPVNSL